MLLLNEFGASQVPVPLEVLPGVLDDKPMVLLDFPLIVLFASQTAYATASFANAIEYECFEKLIIEEEFPCGAIITNGDAPKQDTVPENRNQSSAMS